MRVGFLHGVEHLSGVWRMRAQWRAVALVLTRLYIYLRAASLHLDIANMNLDTQCAKLGEILVSTQQEAKKQFCKYDACSSTASKIVAFRNDSPLVTLDPPRVARPYTSR